MRAATTNITTTTTPTTNPSPGPHLAHRPEEDVEDVEWRPDGGQQRLVAEVGGDHGAVAQVEGPGVVLQHGAGVTLVTSLHQGRGG